MNANLFSRLFSRGHLALLFFVKNTVNINLVKSESFMVSSRIIILFSDEQTDLAKNALPFL